MRGFTLIEISIVLVVIGLLISGGLLGIAPVIQQAKVTQTENTLAKIEDALLLYAIQNSCLPCPADGTSPTTPGQALLAGGGNFTTCTATACIAPAADNTVPWLTLGLQASDAVDEWGTQITYHLSQAATDAGGVTTFCDVLQNNAFADDAASGGFTRTGTTFPDGCLNVEDVVDLGGLTYTLNTEEAAYVLISHGPDTSGGFASNPGNGTRTNNQQATNTVQVENNDGTCDEGGNSPCHQGDPIDLNNTTYFDDIVRWKSAPIIVFQCGDGACGNP